MDPIMKRVSLGCGCVVVAGVLAGCVVTQEVYLEDATLTAPITTPPVMFPPDSGESVQVAGHVSFAQGATLNGRVTENAYAPAGPDNIHWTIPEVTGGIAADIRLGRHFSWTAAMDFSGGGGNALVGGATGLAFHTLGKGAGVWLGFGVMLHPIQYDSRVLVVTTTSGFGSTSVDSTYFHDRGQTSALDFYLGLTVNSRFTDFPLNLFANLLLTRQTLVSNSLSQFDELHAPGVYYSGGAARYRTLVFIASPGISCRISDETEIVGGVRLFFSGDIEGLFESALPTPFIQVQFHL